MKRALEEQVFLLVAEAKAARHASALVNTSSNPDRLRDIAMKVRGSSSLSGAKLMRLIGDLKEDELGWIIAFLEKLAGIDRARAAALELALERRRKQVPSQPRGKNK